jgi:hypothetical protein
MYLSGIEVHTIGLQPSGRTLEWNPEGGRYVESSLAGAPQDGLRVILYAIDAGTGRPALPLSAVGALDLFLLTRADRPTAARSDSS